MSEPLPHYLNIGRRLRSYGVALDEPMMFILGGNVVTSEVDARQALSTLASALQRALADGELLDDFHGDELTDAVQKLTAFHRWRRELLKTAETHCLLGQKTTA